MRDTKELVSYVVAAGANWVAWLDSAKIGAAMSTLTLVGGGALSAWLYVTSRIAKAKNDLWAEREKVEMESRAAKERLDMALRKEWEDVNRNSLLARVEVLEAKSKDKDARISELERLHADVMSQLAFAVTQNQTMAAEVQALRAENDQTARELAAAVADRGRLEQEVMRLRSQVGQVATVAQSAAERIVKVEIQAAQGR